MPEQLAELGVTPVDYGVAAIVGLSGQRLRPPAAQLLRLYIQHARRAELIPEASDGKHAPSRAVAAITTPP